MDEKEIIKWGLIALGAYLIYEYMQQQGGLTNVLTGAGATTTTTGSTTTGTVATQALLNTIEAQLAPMGITLSAAQQQTVLSGSLGASTPLAQLLTAAQMQQIFAYQHQHPASTGNVTTTPPVTTQPPATSTVPTSQQVLAAATSAGEPNNLNMDQWNYYYQQITGQQLSLPPIPTSVFVGAGLSPNADGSGPDMTTPMPVSTWLAIMQLEMPQLGLSGFRGMGSLAGGWRPQWLN